MSRKSRRFSLRRGVTRRDEATRTPGGRESRYPPGVSAAIDAVREALGFERAADRMLRDFFREHRELGARDRELVAETVYAVLRRKRLLEYATEQGDVMQLALAAMVGLLGRNVREIATSETEAGRLEEVKGRIRGVDIASLPLAVAVDMPDWLVARLAVEYDEASLRSLARALAEPASLDLRVNAIKATRDEAIAALRAEHLAAEPTPFAPLGIRLGGRPALVRHPLIEDGKVEVQDEGSQLVCHLVAPRRGEMVVDFCAGAGGKTLALAALMRSSGRVYAFDVSEKRLDRLKPRLARSGVSNVHPQWIDNERDPRVGRLAGKIDRVLVDAPCSGIGTLRRNPDLKWRQQDGDIEEMRVKQASILAAASRLVAHGGRLVYATCSILRAENEAIVEAFLASDPAFTLVDARAVLVEQGIDIPDMPGPWLKLRPDVHGTDGFFAAVLERKRT